MNKVNKIEKIRFKDLDESLYIVPVPEGGLNHFLNDEQKLFLKDWNEAVLIDEKYYITISRHLPAIPNQQTRHGYRNIKSKFR